MVVGRPPATSWSSASRAGGSTAARARRRRRRCTAGDGTLLHNIYDRFRHQAFAEGEAAGSPGPAPCSCSAARARPACSGSAPRAGRATSTTTSRRSSAQVPLGLNTGLSGVPYWGTDIGGFFHPVPETGELYARWFQLGAFSPIFRSHGWVWREHVPWAHGAEVEAICRRYAELRYQLLPYTYTLAWQAPRAGLPLMRPLVLNYPDDPRVVDARPRVPVGRRPAGGAGDARGRHRVAGLSPGGPLVRLLDGRPHEGPAAVTLAGAARPPAAARPRRARSSRWARSSSTRASARSTRSRC